MADTIRKVNYFSLELPNKTGEGARVLTALRDAGVNFTGIWGYSTTARKARMELVPEDSAAFPKAAKQAGIAAGKKQTAFYLNGEDRPGAIADALSRLAQAGINVDAVKAICAGAGRFGAAIFVAPADVRKAGKALGI